MDFFEKAHVVRKKSNDEDIKKRQLKQMLQGYKQNDNEAIKTSAKEKLIPEETFSISSFSEADFINTSVENDSGPESPGSAGSDAEDTTISETDSSKTTKLSEIDSSKASISLTSENIKSLDTEPVDDLTDSHSNQKICLQLNDESILSDNSMTSDYEGIEGFSSDSTSDETKSEDSQPFDPDGSLASKIAQKLFKTNANKPPRITKNVKLSKPTADTKWSTEDISLLPISKPDDPLPSSRESSQESPSNVDSRSRLKSTKSATDRNLQGKDGQSKQELGKRKSQIDLPLKKKIKLKTSDDSWIVEDMSRIKISQTEPNKPLPSPMESSSDECSTCDSESSSETSTTFTTTTDSNSQSNDGQSENTEPFVTMQAPEFICGSLGDILSEYSVPITKVLPCEHRTAPVSSSKIFTSDIVDTGLKGSDEESEPFVEQFNIEGDGSVIDETEMTVDDTVVEEPTNTMADASVIDETVITIDDSLVEEPTDGPVVNESEVPVEESDTSDEEPDYNSNIDSSSDGSSYGNNKYSEPELIKITLDEKVKIYYKKLEIRSDSCILVMQHPAEIYIHGKVRVTVLGGTAEILGFTLNDTNRTYDVFAPHHSHAQYLRTVEADNNNYGLFGRLTSTGLTVPEAEEIVVNLKNNDVVVKLEKLNSRKIDFVEDSFVTSNLFGKTSKYYDKFFTQASAILCCSLYLKAPLKRFEENPAWKNIIQGIDNHSKGIIAGGKGVGKSTFLRYCVNRLLARGPVLVLDLDPGQSEFTPAGNVSATLVTEPLLGPNFTHLRTPDEMLNIGVINVMENLTRYANAVASLIARCDTEPRYQNIPWLLNTMGLCNTVGLKLMTLITLLLRPTFLVQMDSRTAKKNYELKLDPKTIKNLYVEQYQRNSLFRSVTFSEVDYSFFFTEHCGEGVRSQALAPRDERYLNFLAYFGELLEQHDDVQFLEIVPYKVSLENFRIGSNVKFDEEAICKVINGKIVALCEDEGGDNRRKLFTLADKPLRCHGYGLVRGAEGGAEGGVLYVCTPAGRAQLARVSTLLYADWAPELRAARAAGLAPGAALPYRTASDDAHKKYMFTPRRRFNPLKLLKMATIT